MIDEESVDHAEEDCPDCSGQGTIVIDEGGGDYDEDNCQCRCHWP